MKYKEYKPSWVLSSGDKNTYRHAAKWGNRAYFAEPSEALYVYVKERLDLTDEDFMSPTILGSEQVPTTIECNIKESILKELESIAGKINVSIDAMTRIECAYGKSTYDKMRLRNCILENIPDVVVSPSTKEQVIAIFEMCYKSGTKLYFSGGRTNTARQSECYKGGVMLDFKKNYNKIVAFNEVDQTVTVMPGITGIALEEILNNAQDYFGKVSERYTCGHLPGSFEFSTVGGWVMTRSHGANHTGNGDISNILVSAKYLTPKGIIDTQYCNDSSPIPSVDQLFIGSGGEFGLVLEVTLRMKRHYPDAKRLFSYLFRDFDSAARCAKEIMQSENGLPTALRICDPDDTEIIMRSNAVVDKGIIAPFTRKLNGAINRCLLIGSVAGSSGYCRMVKRFVSRTVARYGGISSTSYLSKNREKTMFTDTYVRDLLLDYDVVMDDICCDTSWSRLMDIYFAAKRLVESRPHTFCMAHLGKMTAQGCMLTCECVGKFSSIQEYTEFKSNLTKELIELTKTPFYSHSASMEDILPVISKAHQSLLVGIKKTLDPKNILNVKR